MFHDRSLEKTKDNKFGSRITKLENVLKTESSNLTRSLESMYQTTEDEDNSDSFTWMLIAEVIKVAIFTE